MQRPTVKGPLKIDALRRLRDHKYNVTGISLIEPLFQPFWKWLVEQLPLWVAPNTITMIGLMLNVSSVLIVMSYSPNGNSPIPSWSLFLCAFCLFVYQALDAIDGKQARRTNSSTPLGELFDHGCDSVSTVFVMVSCSVAFGLGEYPNLLLLQCCISIFLFYCAHWQTFVSGQMRFGMIDVTEAQIVIISLMSVSGLMGMHFWTTLVFGVPLKVLVFFGALLPTFPVVVRLFKSCYQGGAGKNGATVANTSVVFPLFPISLLMFLCITIAIKSPSGIFVKNQCLYILAFGMSAVKITNKLVVAHMSKSELELVDSALAGPLMLFLNQYFNCFFNEYHLLWLCCVLSTLDTIKYSMDVCHQIADFLEISVFSIPTSPPQVASTSGGTGATDRSGTSAGTNASNDAASTQQKRSSSPYHLRQRTSD